VQNKLATNKNQHFVPRCYLRSFTQDEKDAAVRVFNIDRLLLIENASVKKQCSGSYFYGENESLESALQFMERSYSATLRKIRKPGYALSEKDSLILKRFWLLQYIRTEAASKRAVEMNNDMGSTVGMDSSFCLKIKDAVLMAMKTYTEIMYIVDDLSSCLIKNNSDNPFLTSDDPAVLSNRWFLSDKRHLGLGFGLRSSGALLILPLSPQILFLAYDSDVYSIRKNKSWVKISASNEAHSFNQHQFLNCRANIYPGPVFNESILKRSFEEFESRRVFPRHKLHYAVLDKTVGNHKQYRVVESPDSENHQEAIVHMQTLFPKPISWPKTIRWRNKGFGMYNGTGAGCLRRRILNQQDGDGYRKMYVKVS